MCYGQQIVSKKRPIIEHAGDTDVKHGKLVFWVTAGIVAAAATTLVLRLHHWRPGLMTIQGAVIRRDSDTRKELPISMPL